MTGGAEEGCLESGSSLFAFLIIRYGGKSYRSVLN